MHMRSNPDSAPRVPRRFAFGRFLLLAAGSAG
jgi:hypothetical protein